MRDYLHFFVNGRQCRVGAEQAFQPLSSYLRQELGITGTKIVCEEGDCGACTTLIAKAAGENFEYRPLNSCIQYVFQVDLCHVITVEGLKHAEGLNPVQESMVKCHGTQCGFCTPGFIVAMSEYFNREENPDPQGIKDCLTGNLCRCTGYEPIIKAGMNVETKQITPLSKLYPPAQMLEILAEAQKTSVMLKSDEQVVFIPAGLEEALEFKADHHEAVIISGGTDVCVNMNKRAFAPRILMSLGNLRGLDSISSGNGFVNVGAKVTLTQLEEFFRTRVPEFHQILWVFGSPQIRNSGTLAGNIANASPIADTPPFLFIMDAALELKSKRGRREVRINEFYKGYKKFDLAADEMISSIVIPLPEKDEIVKLYKVSRRKHLDISTSTAAFRLKLKNDLIEEVAIAYGGVAAVIMRMPKTEAFLKGKIFSLELIKDASEIAAGEISPISDVRGSKEFRLQLARNLMLKLYYDIQEGRVAVCQP